MDQGSVFHGGSWEATSQSCVCLQPFLPANYANHTVTLTKLLPSVPYDLLTTDLFLVR